MYMCMIKYSVIYEDIQKYVTYIYVQMSILREVLYLQFNFSFFFIIFKIQNRQRYLIKNRAISMNQYVKKKQTNISSFRFIKKIMFIDIGLINLKLKTMMTSLA